MPRLVRAQTVCTCPAMACPQVYKQYKTAAAAATGPALLPQKPCSAPQSNPACSRRRALAPAEVSARVPLHSITKPCTLHAAGGGRRRRRRCRRRCCSTRLLNPCNPACGRRRALAPAEVSAEVLRHLVRRAEAYLGGGVDGAVIAVPAHFDAAQRAATAEAGRLAGLASVQLLQGVLGAWVGRVHGLGFSSKVLGLLQGASSASVNAFGIVADYSTWAWYEWTMWAEAVAAALA